MTDDEDQQRKRAYRLWEQEGRPHGRDLEHWHRAQEQHESTEHSEEERPAPTGHPEEVHTYPEGMGKKPRQAGRPAATKRTK